MPILDRLFGRKPAAAPPPTVLPRHGEPDGNPTDVPTEFGLAELDKALDGEKVYVTSSNVEAFQWDRRRRELTVWFLAKGKRPGQMYVYQDVPPKVVTAFVAAPSKGQFVWRNLRDQFLYLGPF